jgi:hypothetical protein
MRARHDAVARIPALPAAAFLRLLLLFIARIKIVARATSLFFTHLIDVRNHIHDETTSNPKYKESFTLTAIRC